ncbi:enoyl-CoA hydratase/isomerase family protein [Nocardiopsis changdeensis]|uniref:3-hydroxyisobutyryl-CoA hydrolase n=1 Tax=Nocardiopsis changdeensis TaxID=2831969 RepID=A0ABX8BJE8_9ACTN|nr:MULTISPECIES: enoyl-CoA hydratase/isomerase family protein [Nocardiopsis]QUX22350.1 enoyl-CoA hydratase/isomerase family protein [Nocardiopsis changdeensis]QYX38291.1 enoyl-CoA hydratase/isomerase family protein [Nocardiopsis sp. MT53]
MSTDGEKVLVRVEGRLGRLTLNRPRAINALDHDMVTALRGALSAWEHDDAVAAVLIDGAGERGLCAGGDIRAMAASARDRDGAAAAFWRDEYLLNEYISRYPKPYVAFMDGVVMGGGVGVSAHGSVRIVTERSTVGMPEATIGFVPDVGGTHLLSRAPGETGTHLALTAGSVGAGDAIALGLADHYVPSARLADLAGALAGAAGAGDVAEAVGRYTGTAPAPTLTGERWIDACYSAGTAEEIVERLRGHGDPAAAAAADTILSKSPTSVKVTLEALRRARDLPGLAEVLEQEYRVSCAALDSPDFVEGVRAQIIDKDRAPKWVPDTLAGVDAQDVARHFRPAPDGPLGLAGPGAPAAGGGR